MVPTDRPVFPVFRDVCRVVNKVELTEFGVQDHVVFSSVSLAPVVVVSAYQDFVSVELAKPYARICVAEIPDGNHGVPFVNNGVPDPDHHTVHLPVVLEFLPRKYMLHVVQCVEM